MMVRGPPKLAERSGETKFRFRVGGGEPRALQTRKRRDDGGGGMERSRLLLQRRWDLNPVSQRLRLRRFLAEGGVFGRVLTEWVGTAMVVFGTRIVGRPCLLEGIRSGRLEVLVVASGQNIPNSGSDGAGLQRPVMEEEGPNRIFVAPAVTGPAGNMATLVLHAATGHGQEPPPEKPEGNPSFELGLTSVLTGLVGAYGPVVTGLVASYYGSLVITGPHGRLKYGEGLQTLKKSPRSNLMPRLLAVAEAEASTISNPTGKEKVLA